MKHYESHFDEYVNATIDNNFHPNLLKTYDSFSNEIKGMKNVILCGPSGSGKYTQSLLIVNKYSPSKLKYEKKISVVVAKNEYIIKISDVHFEIDMSLLGCNAKILWHELYNHIIDIINNRSFKCGIIICKNMQCINNDLLDIFYSYIQNNSFINNVTLKYIFITESVSFFPENIINCSEIIGVGLPQSSKVKKQVKKYIKQTVTYDENVKNLKSLYTSGLHKKSVQDKIIDNICTIIKKKKEEVDFPSIRDSIYELFIYEVDIHECVWKIIHFLVENDTVDLETMGVVLVETQKFFKLYNNNYRPIYHVERYVYTLMMKICEKYEEVSSDCEIETEKVDS